MAPKAKPSGPRWAIHNESFPLTPEENAVVNRHREVWRQHCSEGRPIDAMTLELEWISFGHGAEFGDEEALAAVGKFGSLENYVRYRRLEAAGHSKRFHNANCGLFAENHAIAARMRGIFESLLKQYREGGEDERRLLGLPPVVNDDCTALLERIIGELFKVEQYHPTAFELLENHVALVEIEEEGEQ